MSDTKKPNTLKHLTVLYVEDEESLRIILDEILEKDFKTVYHAANGKKGLEIYKDKHPDIVITDVNMPVMDGFEMTRKILELDQNTPIIFTTAYDEKQFRPMNLNSSVYFFKPVDVSRLMSTLEEIGENLINGRIKKNEIHQEIS